MVTTLFRAGVRDGFEDPWAPPIVDVRSYRAGVTIAAAIGRLGRRAA